MTMNPCGMVDWSRSNAGKTCLWRENEMKIDGAQAWPLGKLRTFRDPPIMGGNVRNFLPEIAKAVCE